MKFLADENFPLPALSALRNNGHEVSSVAEDHAGLSDEAVAEICEREGRILLTFDKDFGEMIFRRGLSAGSAVVLFRIIPETTILVESLRSLLDTGLLLPGVFCVVARDRVRVRPLRGAG